MPRQISKLDFIGTTAELKARISAFIQAKIEHTFTINIPAPREDALIESLAAHLQPLDVEIFDPALANPTPVLLPESLPPLPPVVFTNVQRRRHEYLRNGISNETAIIALLLGDSVELNRLRDLKNVIDNQFPL